MSGADFSLTTFSPNGKLVQIEYALNAVNAGKTSLGIKGRQPTTRREDSEAVQEQSLTCIAHGVVDACACSRFFVCQP